MTFKRAKRIEKIEISEIVQISEMAGRLKREGADMIALSTGEPDAPTPAPIITAAHESALAGQTRYPPTAGTPDLRAALAQQAHVAPENVIVSTGAKQVLSNAMMATLDEGDEIYQHISYVPFTSFAAAAPQLADRLLVVNGVSKVCSMTGWGIGPTDLIKAMIAVQGQITSGACSLSQAAALKAIPGVTCAQPDGAFYVFPDITGLMSKGGFTSDAEACQWILKTANVAIVPGRAFGLPGHARLSFAYSQTDLETGLARITEAVKSLHG